jgi:hypothetical protein
MVALSLITTKMWVWFQHMAELTHYSIMWLRLSLTCGRSVGFLPCSLIFSTNKNDSHDFIHVIELLCYNWRFVNFWLEIWSHNWRFLSTYLMHVFIVNWCFLFVCFSIEPTASHFNIYCLHFLLVVFHMMNEG